MAENDKNWYVIHTYSGHEERVKKNLEQRIKFMDSGDEIFQVVIPTEDEIEVRSGRRRSGEASQANETFIEVVF